MQCKPFCVCGNDSEIKWSSNDNNDDDDIDDIDYLTPGCDAIICKVPMYLNMYASMNASACARGFRSLCAFLDEQSRVGVFSFFLPFDYSECS